MENLGVFDKTQQKTAHWIEGVARYMGSNDMERSYHILRSVLHAVRDRLPPDEAERYRHKREFFDHIAADVPGLDEVQRERAVSAVFTVLNQALTGGEVKQVRHCLPPELREIWHRADVSE